MSIAKRFRDASAAADLRIAFVASRSELSQQAARELAETHGGVETDDAEVIVALGGDGFMLQTLHRHRGRGVPVYGMKTGTVGFLMNAHRIADIRARIAAAQPTPLVPLKMTAQAESGGRLETLAFNEVSLLRQTKQAAKIGIRLNGTVRLEELVCDGVLVATPAGSTAYNLSAHGPILPLASPLLTMTPISPFRPRRWRGAILPGDTMVSFDILDHYKRPVSATADSTEVRDVVEVSVRESREDTAIVLFDPEHSLEERIMNEQFAY